MKERKAYIVLMLICIFLCGGVLTISIKNQETSERRWCGMLAIETIYVPPKPADPKANPQEERVWLIHLARLKLFREFHC